MTKENIPPLPELEIDGFTQMRGITQEMADHVLQIMYERKPDFFPRTAQREDSKVGGPYDAFVQEFEKFMSEELAREIKDIDLTNSKVWTQLFWEMRRRARLMYGMHI